MRSLVWFRTDLRVEDNTALALAAASGEVVAAFLITPEQWRQHDWSPAKVDFLLRTLRVLSADLQRLNIPLLVQETPTFAETGPALLQLAQEHGCQALHYDREYELNEARRDARVSELFSGAGLEVFAHTDQVFAEPGTVLTQAGQFFTVFSPFKRALYRLLEAEPPQAAPRIRKQESIGPGPTPVPERVTGFESPVPSDLWPGGEHEARARLKRFLERGIRRYREQRDFPAIEGTSTLSPYLALGAISPRVCLLAALEANGWKYEGGNAGISQWISELAWREFYKHILVGFPRVCRYRAFRPETEALPWSDDEEHFRAWCEGRTGVPIVDAAMRCLVATGWMHNRLRMVAAMYLTKDLFIDWRRGERFFMQHLVDGDLAANNGGWQWSASTGTDAAPYFRIFNPVSQSRKFDPDGAFIKRWVPELRDLDGGENGTVHDPSSAPLLLRTLDYPAPLVDRSQVLPRVKEAFASIKR